jgi:hypothetical protein
MTVPVAVAEWRGLRGAAAVMEPFGCTVAGQLSERHCLLAGKITTPAIPAYAPMAKML